MSLRITGHWKIADIKEKFNNAFPFLRIEFFRPGPGDGSGGRDQLVPASDKSTVREAGAKQSEDELHIHPAMRVSELTNHFREIYGLHAKVLRKSRGFWLETRKTDHWTLEKQNTEGEVLDE